MKKLYLYGIGLMIVAAGGCGNNQDLLAPGWGGKAEESERLTDNHVYDHNGWRRYNVYEKVELGGRGSREALIRLYVPPKQGIPITAPPEVTLNVHLQENDELNDENFSSLLYHDYYVRGPKAGTHKYLIELKPSQAEVIKQTTYKGRTRYRLTWKLDKETVCALATTCTEVVGDSSNAGTWAISLTSQQWPVGEGGEINSLAMRFKSTIAQDDGQWYITDSWPGEANAGFKILRDVGVPGRVEPRLSDAPIACTLMAGATYHPFDNVTLLSHRSRIVPFKAIGEVEVPETEWYQDQSGNWKSRDVKTHVIAVGQILEVLIEMGEGYCRVRKQGEAESFEMSCPDYDTENFVKVDESILQSFEAYFQANCGEGYKAWIFTTDLWSGNYDNYITDYEG